MDKITYHVDDGWTKDCLSIGRVDGIGDSVRHGGQSLATQRLVLHETLNNGSFAKVIFPVALDGFPSHGHQPPV